MRTMYNRVKRRAKHKFKINEGKKMSYLAKTAPKTFWKHINKKYKKKSVQSDMLNIDECYEHFKNVYSGSTEPPPEQQTNLGDNLDTDLDTEISESEIREAIFSHTKKKTKKAAA